MDILGVVCAGMGAGCHLGPNRPGKEMRAVRVVGWTRHQGGLGLGRGVQRYAVGGGDHDLMHFWPREGQHHVLSVPSLPDEIESVVGLAMGCLLHANALRQGLPRAQERAIRRLGRGGELARTTMSIRAALQGPLFEPP